VQLTAAGGHPGNDLSHAAVRRWTAPHDTVVAVSGALVHEPAAGDGVRAFVVSSRAGVINSATAHASTAPLEIAEVGVQAGETLDFAVDIGGELDSDQFLWKITLTELPAPGTAGDAGLAWHSDADFAGPQPQPLDPWEQLAQTLLCSNEFLFVD
jgi:hypothetical protein